LESTRQYAREKLIDCGEFATVAREHAAAYAALAEDLERSWETTADRAWLMQVETELVNWRAALEWALAQRGDVLLGQRLTGALRLTWAGLAAAEGRRWVRAALEAVDATTPPAVAAKLDLADAQLDGTFYAVQGGSRCGAAGAGALPQAWRPARDCLGPAARGRRARFPGSDSRGRGAASRTALGSSNAGRSQTGARVLQGLASARMRAGDLAGAGARYGEALASAKASGDDLGAAMVAGNLAEAEFRGGDARWRSGSPARRLPPIALATICVALRHRSATWRRIISRWTATTRRARTPAKRSGSFAMCSPRYIWSSRCSIWPPSKRYVRTSAPRALTTTPT